MKTLKIYLTLLAGIFILFSCEKEIEFNGEITQPLIVVNSYLTPDSVVSAQISESRFFLKDSTRFRNISNADVAVWVNGIFKEKMAYTDNGFYNGTYKPEVGDSVRLVVNVPGYSEVTSGARIYTKPTTISLDTTNTWYPKEYSISRTGYSSGGSTVWVNDTIGYYLRHTVNFALKFTDNANEKNFYRLIVETTRHYLLTDPVTQVVKDSVLTSYYFINFSDIVSGNTNYDVTNLIGSGSSYNQYNVFSDDLFNGKTYSLTFSADIMTMVYYPQYAYGSVNPDKYDYKVYLQSISRDYYLYLKSRAAASSGGTDILSEAIQVHNNIVGGIGILGSYTSGNAYTINSVLP